MIKEMIFAFEKIQKSGAQDILMLNFVSSVKQES